MEYADNVNNRWFFAYMDGDKDGRVSKTEFENRLFLCECKFCIFSQM